MIDLWNERNWTPMLLKEVDDPFDSEDYIFELKFDGVRAIIFASPKEIKIFNRKMKEITHLFPELENIKKIVKRDTIFDGEIISMENGKPSFNKLQKRIYTKDKSKIKIKSQNNQVVFICFDILYDKKNLIDKTLIERKEFLKKYKENDHFMVSKYIDSQGKNLYDYVKKINLEGIVAKKKDSIYEINQRTDSWLKIKNFKEEEFFICGYIEKESNFVISLLLGEYKDDDLVFVGKVTLSKKTKLYKEVKNKKIIKNSPYKNFSDKKVNYINPILKCKVKYLERTSNNNLRQPFLN